MSEDWDVLTRQRATRAARGERGKRLRQAVPLDSLAECPRPEDRRDSVALIEQQNGTRDLDLVPLRYERMGADAFAFLRGTAVVMASDLSLRPNSGITVQLCGDAHLDNFGMFASLERSLTFDLNDFDETLPGPFEWDVKRLAASFALAARVRGMGSKVAKRSARAVGSSYRQWMVALSQRPTMEVWYARADVNDIVKVISKGSLRDAFVKAGKKARLKNGDAAAMRLTEVVNGRIRFRDEPPILTPIDNDANVDTIAHVFGQYRSTLPDDRVALLDRFSFVQTAFKVVGVGSVGTRAYVLLFQSGDGEPLVLQAKQADASVLESYLEPSEFTHHGQRVVNGQRLIQSTSDPFLGWSTGDAAIPFDFYIRQLWDMKGRIDVTRLDEDSFATYAKVCAAALARAHARAGDASLIAGYIGDGKAFDHAVRDYAIGYARLMEADHARFSAWVTESVSTPVVPPAVPR